MYTYETLLFSKHCLLTTQNKIVQLFLFKTYCSYLFEIIISL